MARRELVAFTAGPLVLAAIVFLPAWVFLSVLGAILVGAADELIRMARSAGHPAQRLAAPLLVAVVLAAAWLAGPVGLVAAVAGVLLITPVLQMRHADSPDGGLSGSAVSAFAVLYLGVTGACFGWLRTVPTDEMGWRLVVLFMVTIWLGDSGAYYVGRQLGRHKMSPRVSPNKTWEGLAGGTVATLLGATAVAHLLQIDLGWTQLLGMALIIAVAAPVGDLVESLLKRDTGVKDSSGLLPGHGGLLDRTDSLLFAAPPVLGFLLLTGALG
jgi:phosphatidate cytidylyltransferase